MLFRLRLLYFVLRISGFRHWERNQEFLVFFFCLFVYSREHITASILKSSLLSKSQSVHRTEMLNYLLICNYACVCEFQSVL